MRGSLVPGAQIVELRDRTRRRKRLWSAANSERNRIQKLLEPAIVKIGNVVSDVFGISGQRIPHALLTLETRWLAFSLEITSVTPLPRLLLRSFAVLSKMRAWEIEALL